jgi:putative ATPase
LKSLNQADLSSLIDRALRDSERGLGKAALQIDDDARELLIAAADGDARRLLNLLETAADLGISAGDSKRLDVQAIRSIIGSTYVRFDKGGENFYDQISALHKSVRGSSPDAALYWLVRMLDGGADPLYVGRRLVRMAVEDIGLADPRALRHSLDACETDERLGSPEGELALAQATIYLACAAKSNAAYVAYNEARSLVQSDKSRPVPEHLRNAPTKLMKELGYGRSYRYAHDEEDAYAAGENYFPEGMENTSFYRPTSRGLEGKIAEKLAQLRALDLEAKKKN